MSKRCLTLHLPDAWSTQLLEASERLIRALAGLLKSVKLYVFCKGAQQLARFLVNFDISPNI
jgi:hypothetical protein